MISATSSDLSAMRLLVCRYGDAVLQGVEQMGRALAGQDGKGGGGDSKAGWFALFGALGAGVLAYFWWSSRKQTKRYKGSGATSSAHFA